MLIAKGFDDVHEHCCRDRSNADSAATWTNEQRFAAQQRLAAGHGALGAGLAVWHIPCAAADSPVLKGAMAYSQRTVARPCFSVALELGCLGPKTEARTCMNQGHAAVLRQQHASMSECADAETLPLCCPWKRWLIHLPAGPALRSRTATVSTPSGACHPVSAAQGL